MGGHKAGEIASELAVDSIKKSLGWLFEQDDAEAGMATEQAPTLNGDLDLDELLEQRLSIAVQEANQTIYDYARNNPTKAGNLGCTTTCVVVSGSTAFIANVGDSRTYHFKNGGRLSQITDDHSYVWQLVQDGYLSTQELYDHPQRNVITRALGSRSHVDVDTWICPIGPGDKLLLCSDGMWEMIRDPEEIAYNLKKDGVESAVNGLIEAANYYGGLDNIGVVVAELLESRP
jgi:protein phosphatase